MSTDEKIIKALTDFIRAMVVLGLVIITIHLAVRIHIAEKKLERIEQKSASQVNVKD